MKLDRRCTADVAQVRNPVVTSASESGGSGVEGGVGDGESLFPHEQFAPDAILDAAFIHRTVPSGGGSGGNDEENEPPHAVAQVLKNALSLLGKGQDVEGDESVTAAPPPQAAAAAGAAGGAAAAAPAPGAVSLSRASLPLNEFEENDVLFLSTYPFLFFKGIGLPFCSSPNPDFLKYVLSFHDGRFDRDRTFIFMCFEQYMRHAVARSVKAKVSSDPKHRQTLEDFISENVAGSRCQRELYTLGEKCTSESCSATGYHYAALVDQSRCIR